MVMEKDTNRPVTENQEHPDQTARRIMAKGKRRKERVTKKANTLWLWLGVIILIFIILWWLWTIGMSADITGTTNG